MIVTVIGTVGAIVFPMDDITDFLYLIGSVFAPMIAVQIADAFILHSDASAKELSALVRSLREELFNLRLQQATGQLENNQRIRTVRKDLARALTIKGETGEV